jgi:hypothetical protein
MIEIALKVNGKSSCLYCDILLKTHLRWTWSSEPDPHRVTAPAPPKMMRVRVQVAIWFQSF